MNEGLIEGGHCSQVGDCVTVGGSGAFGEPSWAAQILNISGLASRGLLGECQVGHVAVVMLAGSCPE